MKNKTIYLNKGRLYNIIQMAESHNIDFHKFILAYPDREEDYETLEKCNEGTFKAYITNTRILWKHKNFFRKLKLCVTNGIIQRMINKGEIHPVVIDNLREMLKKDIEVLRYILKWRYLELETEYLPDGNKIERVSSQAFDELDELIFDEFINNCYNYLADLFGVSRNEFNRW
jgi:hypothetical protein